MSEGTIFGAEFRELAERTHNGKRVRVVAASRVFATSQEDLWDALTNKDRLPRWFAEVEGKLELGGKYKIKGNAKGKIIECTPPETFELTWVMFFNTSWVTVRLAPEDTGTRLTLEHIMTKGRLAEGHWRKYGPGATGVGWDIGFLSLDQHIETGGGQIDQKAQEAWMATDEGKAFLRTCAAAWGEAHIKGGEAADVATEMAENTAKFYSGE